MRRSETGEPKENKQKIKKDVVVVHIVCIARTISYTFFIVYANKLSISYRRLKTTHTAKGSREGREREKSVITGQLRFVVCRWIMFKDMQRSERGPGIPNSKDLFVMKTFGRPFIEWHVSWSSCSPSNHEPKESHKRGLEDANLTKARQSLETVD